MTDIVTTYTPIQQAVASSVGLPTIEQLLREGHLVSLKALQDEIGDRLVIQPTRLCVGHVRSLASSILKHKEVVVPLLMIERDDQKYEVKDGLHRLAALSLLKETHPEVEIKANVKLFINH